MSEPAGQEMQFDDLNGPAIQRYLDEHGDGAEQPDVESTRLESRDGIEVVVLKSVNGDELASYPVAMFTKRPVAPPPLTIPDLGQSRKEANHDE
ncbi:hypothetical protein ACIBSW_34470 [Actinoplanes sp. NPDC049668]|uniref:hypothetical protein n=1 Tax=unclassified Actinoplanes TaxID=2626549 RepID=UPI0033A48DCB